MGTMGYMSPEQVRGLPVDHRSDLFSFGAILYEMLSGKKAFKRDTASDTIAAILQRGAAGADADQGRNVSPALDHIVRHCLEKDREIGGSSPRRTLPSRCRRRRARRRSSGAPFATPPRREEKGSSSPCGGGRRLLAAVGVLFMRRPQRGGRREAGGVKRVAVLPFENLGAPEDDYFADGIADADPRQARRRCRASRSSPAAARRPTRRRPRRRRRSRAS